MKVGLAATVETAATMTPRLLPRLLDTQEITLLGVVFGIACTVGAAVGAAMGGWTGAGIGLAAAIGTFVIEALILRSRSWHRRLTRLAGRLRPRE